MSHKEKFVMFVYLGAIARDLANETNDSQRIAGYASQIPARRIPHNPLNAAQVFLHYFSDGAAEQPFRWMCSRRAA